MYIIPHPSKKIEGNYPLKQWILLQNNGLFKIQDNIGGGYNLDAARYGYTYNSNLYLIFWPKDGIVGPKQLRIEEYGYEGGNRIHLDFGLPFLFRLGGYLDDRSGTGESKLLLTGNYLHPETKQAVPSEEGSRSHMTWFTVTRTSTSILWDLHVVNPFVVLEDFIIGSDNKDWQITIHDQYECYGYVSTNPQDVESLERITGYMAYMYRVWENTRLFDPLLKNTQQSVNILRREGRDLPADEFRALESNILMATSEYLAEAIRIHERYPL
jgi:hypothetical protein